IHWAMLEGPKDQDSGLKSQDSSLKTQASGLKSQDSGLRSQDSGLLPAPVSVISAGGHFICHDNTEVPDTFETVLEYPGFISIYSLRRGNASPQNGVDYGTAFYGENGTMILNREGWRVMPEKGRGTRTQ